MHRKQSFFIGLSFLCAVILAALISIAFGFANMGDRVKQKQENAVKQSAGNEVGAVFPVKNTISAIGKAKILSDTGAKTQIAPPLGKKNKDPAGKEKGIIEGGKNKRGILNGYKGYRYHRSGYKSAGDGWWYPRAAFAKKSAKESFMEKPEKGQKTPGQGRAIIIKRLGRPQARQGRVK